MGQKSSSSYRSVDNQPYSSYLPEEYRFVNILGEGSYGKVLRCQDRNSKCFVAVKIPKQFQNDQEVSVLKMLMQHEFDQRNIVKFHNSFNTAFGKAMVFEALDMSLLGYMSMFRLHPIKLSEVRTIVQQVATALDALKSVGIIHADLKLNNIMLVDHVRKPLELKVIDFGLAMKTSKVKRGKQVQILPYRAPEVILGLPLSEAIDMWALGNLMFNLVTGGMLHASSCEFDAINLIVNHFGQPADHLLENGMYTKKYFNKTDGNSWRIKTRREYFGHLYTENDHHVNIRTSDNWKSMGSHANSVERDQCFELLEAMMKLDPNERITPSEVLKHPFITNSFNSDDASGSGQTKRSVRPPPPQWSTPSDTDSCMIFNFGNNSPRSQPSPSIHESLNCEPPATAVTDDANDRIQPDHQSPSPAVQPSGVMVVHPATDLSGQDYHRSAKSKVGPAAAKNTSELEDEESSVSLEARPSTSTKGFFNSGLPATALNTANIQPDCQRSLCEIKVGPAALENTSELEDDESSVSLQAGPDPTSESIAEVKESDKMETKEKKKKKNRIQRTFAWMRKTFSSLSRNRNVMDTG